MSATLALAAALAFKDFKHVTFDGIPPTIYAATPTGVTATVDKSASFLLLPFAEPRSVKSIRFTWRTTGTLNVASAAQEATKAGDDARLKVGLLLAGEPPMLPMFAPAWLRTIKDVMLRPSDRILYLVAGARHAPGRRWKSPYSESLDNVAVATAADGQVVHAVKGKPLAVVGVWIMADGDDTRSRFVTTFSLPQFD